MSRAPRDKIDEFIVAHHDTYTDERIVEKLNDIGLTIGVEALRKRRRAMGIQKTTNQGNLYFRSQIERLGITDDDWKMAWDKSDGLSVLVHNPNYRKQTFNDFKESFIKEMQEYSPKYPQIKRTKIKDGHCLVVNMTDIHVGENTETVINRCHAAIDDIITKSSVFPISQIIFAGGNDVIHIDTDHHTTTKGTQLHAEMRPEAIFVKAKDLYVALIEKLLTIAPVHYVHIPDNHAKISGFHLSELIATWFRNTQHFTADVSHHYRKRFVFGDNLICFAHGHGVRDNDRPLDFATVFAKEWGQTHHRYGYLGHIHHNKSIISKHIKEMPGIEIQWLRSVQLTNDYEDLKGYHSKAGISTFIHHPTEGQIARFNKNF